MVFVVANIPTILGHDSYDAAAADPVIRSRPAPRAVLPFGHTEDHGRHGVREAADVGGTTSTGRGAELMNNWWDGSTNQLAVCSRSALVELAAVLPATGRFVVARLDGARMTVADHAFYEFSDALLFPGWFGWNWDALSDCLRDLNWLPADGYLIVVENAHPVAVEHCRGTAHAVPDPVSGRSPLGEPARPTGRQGRPIQGAADVRPRRGGGAVAAGDRQRSA